MKSWQYQVQTMRNNKPDRVSQNDDSLFKFFARLSGCDALKKTKHKMRFVTHGTNDVTFTHTKCWQSKTTATMKSHARRETSSWNFPRQRGATQQVASIINLDSTYFEIVDVANNSLHIYSDKFQDYVESRFGNILILLGWDLELWTWFTSNINAGALSVFYGSPISVFYGSPIYRRGLPEMKISLTHFAASG